MAGPRYFTPDYHNGITRGQFRRLRRDEKLEVMEAWFRQHYEDPAQQTPYESAEGGYIYIWGGPYGAREELEGEFGNLASQTLIEQLVAKLEDESYEWAPVDHGDVSDPDGIADADGGPWPPLVFAERDELDEISEALSLGAVPTFGSVEERSQRAEIIARLSDLETELQKLRRPRGMIGHNNPPEPVDALPMGERDRRDLQDSAAELRIGLSVPAPDIAKAVGFTRKLRGALLAVGKWTGKKVDGGIDAFVKAIAGAGGAAAVLSLSGAYSHLVETMVALYPALLEWLQTVISKF